MKRLSICLAGFALVACGGGGGGGSTPTPTPPVAVTCTAPQVLQNGACVTPTPTAVVQLSSSPANVQLGQITTLTWTTSGVTSCMASGAWSGSLTTSGTKVVMPLKNGVEDYVVTCDGTNTSSTKVTTVSNDVADYATKDVSALLSLAGEWSPFSDLSNSTNPAPALIDFYGVPKLGVNQLQGLAFAGWAYTGFTNTATETTPVYIALLSQKTDGTLSLNNSTLPSVDTNGAGSVIIADFNGDGKDDIFLAAHNESPFMLKASTVYLSKVDGTFNKITLNDAVMAHDAILGRFNGKPAVIITSFGMNAIVPFSAAYTYNGAGGFDITTIAGASYTIPAMSVTTGDFLGLGHDQFVYGDIVSGPGFPWLVTTPMQAVLYDFNGINILDTPIFLPTPYFNNKSQYSSFVSNWDPTSKSHQSRMWTDDINQDGKPDIIIGTEIWPGWKSALQMLINQGAGSFSDKTNEWKFPWNEDGGYDYSMRMVDIDGSGINTYLTAQLPAYCPQANCRSNALHGDYIIVNDGTGQFHLAMHDEFVNIGNQINSYLVKIGIPYVYGTDTPRIIAYQTSNNKINFVAKINLGKQLNGQFVQDIYFVNIPLQINLTTDFKKNILITNRNGSKNIRTFAGDDTIAGGCSSFCSVDGGYGINTISYGGKYSNYTITKTSTGYTVADKTGNDGTDNIKNIQLLKFTDTTIDLRTANF